MPSIATKTCSHRSTNTLDASISTHRKPSQGFRRSVATPLQLHAIRYNLQLYFTINCNMMLYTDIIITGADTGFWKEERGPDNV